jgi:hypothetical protein
MDILGCYEVFVDGQPVLGYGVNCHVRRTKSFAVLLDFCFSPCCSNIMIVIASIVGPTIAPCSVVTLLRQVKNSLGFSPSDLVEKSDLNKVQKLTLTSKRFNIELFNLILSDNPTPDEV